MSAIYIHIPFCRTKCNYCNFYSLASGKWIEGFTEIICQEAVDKKKYFGSQTVETIYFGGGTPSLLFPKDIEKVMQCLHTNYAISSEAEITLEANPEDLKREKLDAYKSIGINRLSIGIQSFRDTDLQYLRRRHNSQQSIDAIELVLNSGFTNLSLDLIYGIPTLDLRGWEKNLAQIVHYKIPHLSAYALTIEPNTILQWQVTNKIIPGPEADSQADQFMFLMQWANNEGYRQYEISNFCQSGMHSKHNSSYWRGSHYLGLGPSAHSYNGKTRQWNTSNLQRYSQGVKTGHLAFELETLTASDVHNEYVMTALRTDTGINLDEYPDRFGAENFAILCKNMEHFLKQNWALKTESHVMLTPHGKLFADKISAALFI